MNFNEIESSEAKRPLTTNATNIQRSLNYLTFLKKEVKSEKF